MLKPKVEGLPDDHPFGPECLDVLSALSELVGNYVEEKCLLTHTLKLGRQREDRILVDQTSRRLIEINWRLGFIKEGILRGKEALEIYEWLGDTAGQAFCFNDLAWSLFSDKQLDAAENTAFRAIDLITGKGHEFILSKLYRVLGLIYYSKGEKEKAIYHFETALRFASPPNWHTELFCSHHDLAELFYNEGELDNANTHIAQAKSHVVSDTYHMSHAMMLGSGLVSARQVQRCKIRGIART